MKFAVLLLVPFALFADSVTSNVSVVKGRSERHIHWIPSENRFTDDVLPPLAEAETLEAAADELSSVYAEAETAISNATAGTRARIEELKRRPVVTLSIAAGPENAVDRRNLTMVVMSNEVTRITPNFALSDVNVKYSSGVSRLESAGYPSWKARSIMDSVRDKYAPKRKPYLSGRLGAAAPYGVRVRTWMFGNAVLKSAPVIQAWVYTKLGETVTRIPATWAGDGYGTNGVTIVRRGEEYECFELDFDIPPEVYNNMTVLILPWLKVGDPVNGFDYGNRQRRVNGLMCVTTNDFSFVWSTITTTNGTDLTAEFLPYLDRGKWWFAAREEEQE